MGSLPAFLIESYDQCLNKWMFACQAVDMNALSNIPKDSSCVCFSLSTLCLGQTLNSYIGDRETSHYVVIHS